VRTPESRRVDVFSDRALLQTEHGKPYFINATSRHLNSLYGFQPRPTMLGQSQTSIYNSRKKAVMSYYDLGWNIRIMVNSRKERVGAWIVAVLICSSAILTIYSIAALWSSLDVAATIRALSPTATGVQVQAHDAAQAMATVAYQRYAWWGFTFWMTPDQHIIALVILAGILGGSLQTLISSSVHMGNGEFKTSWSAYYLTRPIEGAVLGVLAFVILRAGLMPSGPALENPAGPVAVGALMGLFSSQAREKLKQVFETMFAAVPPQNKPGGPPLGGQTFQLTIAPPAAPLSRTPGTPDVSVDVQINWPAGATAPAQLTVAGLPTTAFSITPPTVQYSAQGSKAQLVLHPPLVPIGAIVVVTAVAGSVSGSTTLKLP
jgi:hypothetical protein